MEIDVRQRRNQRNRRRERAQRMQAERDRDVVAGGEPDDSADEESSKPPVREKPPQRRKKPKELSPLLEEDIIDGFAILAFKTYEDLEVSRNQQSFILIFFSRHLYGRSQKNTPRCYYIALRLLPHITR